LKQFGPDFVIMVVLTFLVKELQILSTYTKQPKVFQADYP